MPKVKLEGKGYWEDEYNRQANLIPGTGQGRRKLKGGMEKKFIDAFISHLKTLKTKAPIVQGRFNPLAQNYYGVERDQGEQNVYDFLLKETDAIDKVRLGLTPGPGQPVSEEVIPAFRLLNFTINGTYNLPELYKKFVSWFPQIEPPTLETNFMNYRGDVIGILMDHILDVLEKKKDKFDFNEEFKPIKPTKTPLYNFPPIPPKKGRGKICRKCGGIRSTVKKGKKSSLPEINEF